MLAPLIGMTALAIKLSAVGPVILRQRRTGFDGREFFVYKFRTTPQTVDGTLTPRIRRSSGLASIAQVLRQSGVDDLPQLVKVLKGEMSVVGPECQANAGVECVAPSTFAHQRHFKPGMIGWVEVSEPPGEAETMTASRSRLNAIYGT